MNIGVFRFPLVAIILFCAGCANITAPTGGKRDTKPPILLSVDPGDSQKNAKIDRIELEFNKYITVSDVTKELQLSPILAIQPTARVVNKRVIVKIVDTLLEDSTTYRLSFGNSIKDVHEGNVFAKYVYTFSTGPYFDSLTLNGSVINAATGLADTGKVSIELYYSKDNDSAVVRHKPKYVTKADSKGNFEFKGLPKRSFRIYGVKDANDNLIYDGIGEMIAFKEQPVVPGDTLRPHILLRLFAENIDTSTKKATDTSAVNKNIIRKVKQAPPPTYIVALDTSNVTRRTFDINGFIKVSFNKTALLNRGKIRLTYDSLENEMPAPAALIWDSLHPNELHILLVEDSVERKELHTAGLSWKENTVYTLRFPKGFAKDTGGVEFSPSKYIFRTRQEEDYGKITMHLPSRYLSESDEEKASGARFRHDTIPDFLLMVTTDKDTLYTKKITDTIVSFTRLAPATYKFRVIVDKNKNGRWDTGDLFAKRQPEEIIPLPEGITVKPGWDYPTDFEQKPAPKTEPEKPGKSLIK